MSQEPFDFSSTAESDFAPSHAYVSKKTKIEDVTSTAYTFTIVSVAGFILLILFGLDLLPFQSYVCHLLFRRHKILYGIKNAFKCS